MLSSSLEYLQALRKGEYIQFLEWTTFIAKKYAKEGEELNGDSLVDCFIFEWLSVGFKEEDVEKIAILQGVFEQNPSPIQSRRYAYSFISSLSALFCCMAFNLNKSSELAPVFPKTKMTEKQVQGFVKQILVNIDDAKISQMRTSFMQQVAQVDVVLINSITKEIAEFVDLIGIWENYVISLTSQQAQEQEGAEYKIRQGIAGSFLNYLKAQTKLTDIVRYEMTLYVQSIRAQHPSPWEEEEYLQKVSPSSIVDKTERTLTRFVFSFFSLLMSPGKEAVATSSDNESASSIPHSAIYR